MRNLNRGRDNMAFGPALQGLSLLPRIAVQSPENAPGRLADRRRLEHRRPAEMDYERNLDSPTFRELGKLVLFLLTNRPKAA